jgi:hypothetical protein
MNSTKNGRTRKIFLVLFFLLIFDKEYFLNIAYGGREKRQRTKREEQRNCPGCFTTNRNNKNKKLQ